VNIIIDEYPRDQLGEYKHNKGGLWLKDGVVQVKFVKQWKKILMTSETLVALTKLWAKCLILGLSMKAWDFNKKDAKNSGLVQTFKCSLEVIQFVCWWDVQRREDTHELVGVGGPKLLSIGVEKGKC
jgi:hypothetical protein